MANLTWTRDADGYQESTPFRFVITPRTAHGRYILADEDGTHLAHASMKRCKELAEELHAKENGLEVSEEEITPNRPGIRMDERDFPKLYNTPFDPLYFGEPDPMRPDNWEEEPEILIMSGANQRTKAKKVKVEQTAEPDPLFVPDVIDKDGNEVTLDNSTSQKPPRKRSAKAQTEEMSSEASGSVLEASCNDSEPIPEAPPVTLPTEEEHPKTMELKFRSPVDEEHEGIAKWKVWHTTCKRYRVIRSISTLGDDHRFGCDHKGDAHPIGNQFRNLRKALEAVIEHAKVRYNVEEVHSNLEATVTKAVELGIHKLPKVDEPTLPFVVDDANNDSSPDESTDTRGTKMEVTKASAVRLLQAIGIKTASLKWSLDKVQSKVNVLHKTAGDFVPEEKKDQKLLKRIVAALQAREEVEIVDADAIQGEDEGVKVEAKVSGKQESNGKHVEAEAPPAKKRGRPAKVKVEVEETEKEETPAPTAKKRGRPAKVKAETDEEEDTPKTKPTKVRKEASVPKVKREGMSGLDAAAKVLEKAKSPMNKDQILAEVLDKGYWTSTRGKTPADTIKAAMLVEIVQKGKDSRFKKVDRGLFAYNS